MGEHPGDDNRSTNPTASETLRHDDGTDPPTPPSAPTDDLWGGETHTGTHGLEQKRRLPTPLQPRWVAAALAVGVATDLALRRFPWNNLALTLVVLFCAMGLLVSGFARTRSSRVLLLVAALFGIFLAWRTGQLLTTFNIVTAAGLLVGAALVGRHGAIWDLSPSRIGAMAAAVAQQTIVTPLVGIEEGIARYQAVDSSEHSGVRATVRGLAIALPIVFVLGSLLASADVVFRSFFSGLDIRLGPLVGHLFLATLGIVAMATMIRLAAADPAVSSRQQRLKLGPIEAAVLLGSITALFAAFTVAQLMTVLGGADEALARAGLDPKHFARQGFFQLLWVAGITLAVVMSVRVLTAQAENGQTVLKWFGLITVGLTMAIVAVALTRIFFYVGDSGLTPRRLYAVVLSVWIATCFVLLALRLVGFKTSTAWLTPACLASAVAILVLVNLSNPNRLIAEDNLNRNQDDLVWHVRHGQFVGEGRATLANNLDRLSPDLAAEVGDLLCAQYGQPGNNQGYDVLSYNRGRDRAETAISNLCP